MHLTEITDQLGNALSADSIVAWKDFAIFLQRIAKLRETDYATEPPFSNIGTKVQSHEA
jgi:hypothetical protein